MKIQLSDENDGISRFARNDKAFRGFGENKWWAAALPPPTTYQITNYLSFRT